MIPKKKVVISAILFFVFSFFLFNFAGMNSAFACSTDANCGANAECLSGLCKCLESRGNCDDNWDNGCEIDLATNVNYCGYCSTKCAAGKTCEDGFCKGSATTSYCTTVKCGANSTCSYDSCYCAVGYKDCNGDKISGTSGDGCEIYSYGDVNNCGSCGRKCSTGYSCQNGSCVSGGTSTVPGTTTTTTTTTTGSSGFASCTALRCGVDGYCFDGKCMCSAGTKNCDGSWTNGCECTGLYVGCSGTKCGCQTGFNDCDGNSKNGCETGGACPPCKFNETRVCNTTSICDGRQVCSRDGYWGECLRTIPQICTPGSSVGCTPTIDGKKCPTVSGVITCNSCGSKYGACSSTTKAVCCPNLETGCVIGACTGTKSCAEDGTGWGSCVSGDGTSCCAQDTDCNDFNGCTTEKCVNSKCEFNPVEDCRGLTPVKCKTDSNCASKDSCVGGSCLPLQCNAEFIIENHKCVCTGKECGNACHFSEGICCSGYWNDDFDSCSFDFGYYKERITLSLNKEADKLLKEAEGISAQGDLRRASVLAKIAIAIAEITLSTEGEPLKNQATGFINEAKILLASGNYSASLDKVDEALGLLDSGVVQTKETEDSLWQKNKVPIIIFSSIVVALSIFIFYIIIVPKI